MHDNTSHTSGAGGGARGRRQRQGPPAKRGVEGTHAEEPSHAGPGPKNVGARPVAESPAAMAEICSSAA